MSKTQRPAPPGGVASESDGTTACRNPLFAAGQADGPVPGAAIALTGVNLSLGRGAARVHILKSIDLHIGAGEAIGLVGPSGSGKSTLLMVMAGLERADAGEVVVAGEALGGLGEDALARFRGRHIGIVFQSFHLIPTMTALENIAVPLELAGIHDADVRAERELAAVGLAERRDHYPAQLSGGEQQRVALARALAPDPAILIADEPTGNLDETPAAKSSTCCSPDTPSATPRWCWSRTTPRWRGAATVWFGCAPAGSSTSPAARRSPHECTVPARRPEAVPSILPRSRSASRCARCAAGCAASTSSSLASRSA